MFPLFGIHIGFRFLVHFTGFLFDFPGLLLGLSRLLLSLTGLFPLLFGFFLLLGKKKAAEDQEENKEYGYPFYSFHFQTSLHGLQYFHLEKDFPFMDEFFDH